MASDANPVQIPATSLVHGSRAPTTVVVEKPSGHTRSVTPSGKSLPPSGNTRSVTPAHPAAAAPADIQAQVNLLNKYLNDSGRPAQFRVDPTSDNKLIQEINPATGEVIAEYSVIEFPELARSVGVSGVLVDNRA
jgi:uncharacterized FlaG/YvyC family protein